MSNYFDHLFNDCMGLTKQAVSTERTVGLLHCARLLVVHSGSMYDYGVRETGSNLAPHSHVDHDSH